jgi:hypothetical protein
MFALLHGALAVVACLTFVVPVSAVEEASDASTESLDGGPTADASMAPPDEDDPASSCSCVWKDELPEGTLALGLPWVALLFVRRATRVRS